MIVPALVGATVQVAVVLLLCFVVFLVAQRKLRGFPEWLGLKRPTSPAVRMAFVLLLPMIALSVLINELPSLQPYFANATGFNAILRDASRPLGATLMVAAIHGLIQTGLSEELLFRGLLGHRLAQRFPFAAANLVQATLFAVVHGVFPILAGVELPLTTVVFLFLVFPFAAAWAMGWLNERRGNGSIVPSWLVHGLGNTVAYAWVALSVRS